MKRSARVWVTLGTMVVPFGAGCSSDDPGADGTASSTSSGGQPASGGESSAGAAGGTTGTGGDPDTVGSGGFVPFGNGGSEAGGASSSASEGTDGAGGAPTAGGTPGSGGSADAEETTCGTAGEDGSVRLNCADGYRIESVSFSSYGTPTGECGTFMEGACHAATSASAVEDICLGRAACTIPASNSMFTDPCNSTEKSLAVEVACALGEPRVDPEPYKGVANSPVSEINELGATWCYNWTTAPSVTDCGDPLFVPMIWGGGNVASALADIAAAGYDTVLGFNEPNKVDQANMSVEDAIAEWPALTSDPNIRVGSPAVSDDGRAWLEDFMAQVEENGLRVDFIAMHWYGWNAGSCTAGNLQGAVNWASQWGLPVWITEFGCMGSSNTDEATLIQFFNDSMEMLENHPLVERYAWYPWNTYSHLYLPDENDVRQRTALGDTFLEAAPYR